MARLPKLKVKENAPESHEPINCVAFTFQASKEKGFSNFKIVTLFVRNGEIVHVEKGQEFATFEAIARSEVFVSAAIWNLSSRYRPGLYTTLGGDQVRELLPRLEKQNPEALERILPLISPETQVMA